MAEITIHVLEERIENLKIQLLRLMSHIESEQRVSNNHDQRIISHDKWINRMQVEIDGHDKILSNGEGLVVKMDRLIQYVKNQEILAAQQKTEAEKFQWTLPNIIAVLSLLATIGLGILMFLKGV